MELQQLKKDLEQEHIVNWLESSVVKSITPQQVGHFILLLLKI